MITTCILVNIILRSQHPVVNTAAGELTLIKSADSPSGLLELYYWFCALLSQCGMVYS